MLVSGYVFMYSGAVSFTSSLVYDTLHASHSGRIHIFHDQLMTQSAYNRPVGKVFMHAIKAESLGFDSQAGQISVTNG